MPTEAGNNTKRPSILIVKELLDGWLRNFQNSLMSMDWDKKRRLKLAITLPLQIWGWTLRKMTAHSSLYVVVQARQNER